MEQVTLLEQNELVHLDSDRLEELYIQLGSAGAEDVMCRAMEELALRLSHCEVYHRSFRFDEMRKAARSLIAIADQIGMADLARVAGHVMYCADQGDRIALAATLARLLRVGERSLSELWELQEFQV